ncbi:MAG: hypothetical protein U5N55_05010 [Cypionkella sp.]|nr:hypothetical protein [Cypionkella sp.]
MWVKAELGYLSPILSPSGEVICQVVDSTAFDKMDQAAFNLFHQQAAELIAREMGIDMGGKVWMN